MEMKVLMILVDGMRPDSIADIQLAQNLIAASASTMAAKPVMPSVTLPCHMSLFHSVTPSRHRTDCTEDMTIPLIIRAENFPAGSTLEDASILDIAPTVAKLLNTAPDHEWEGKSLL